MKTAIELIAKERQRQIEKEGFGHRHDNTHRSGELCDAAGCYVKAAAKLARGESLQYLLSAVPAGSIGFQWPWEEVWWKPSDDPIRNLVKAGALIVAEIERIQRSNP